MRIMLALVLSAVFTVVAVAREPKVGDTVWAQWRPNQWYHGKIDQKADVGFHIKFDDGDETDVPPALVVVDEAPKKDALKPGARIVVPAEGPVRQLATVVKVDGDSVECKLEDLADSKVELKEARLIAAGAPEFKVGDVVWAQWRPNDWYHGKVAKKIDIGYHIEFDDGDEADLPAAVIALDKAPAANAVKSGSRVIALFSDGKYYPGVVAGVDKKTCKIKYDDGDEGETPMDDVRVVGK